MRCDGAHKRCGPDGLRERSLLSAFGPGRFAHKLGDQLLATAEPLGARASRVRTNARGSLTASATKTSA